MTLTKPVLQMLPFLSRVRINKSDKHFSPTLAIARKAA